MNQRASYIGELAARIFALRRTGEVTRVFQRSVYLKTGKDFVLLLWGELRSPMTVNVVGRGEVLRQFRHGERCTFDSDDVRFEKAEITMKGAEVHRSSLLVRRVVGFPSESALVKGVSMLKSLYDVSPSGPKLPADGALNIFVRMVLSPFSEGRPKAMFRVEGYLPLIGRGGGFTPAGDDFVGGFLATFNYIARCRRSRQVSLPRASISSRTVPESAAILGYSLKGYVDEGLERLILKTLEGGDSRFYDDLLAVAHRGHTSGIDMSLGVLLCEAAMSDAANGGRALKGCFEVLRNP